MRGDFSTVLLLLGGIFRGAFDHEGRLRAPAEVDPVPGERSACPCIGVLNVHGHVPAVGVDDVLRTLMLDPQTSGGLLVGVPEAHAGAWDRACAAHGVSATRIGEVTEGQGVIVTA